MQDARTVVELFAKRVAASGDSPALRYRDGDRWRHRTWSELRWEARRIAAGLILLGAQPGDRVGVVSEASAQWATCDLAIQMAGCVTVAIHPTTVAGVTCSLVHAARCRFVFVEDVDLCGAVSVERSTLAGVEKVVLMRPERPSAVGTMTGQAPLTASMLFEPAAETDSWLVTLDDLALSGEESLAEKAGALIESRATALRPDDVSTIVFTSGTGDEPRAVASTHRNHLAAIMGLCQALPIERDDVQLFTLPGAHVRGLVAWRTSIATGATIAMWGGPQRLAEDLQAVRPTFLFGTPQLCEKAYVRIMRDAQNRGGIEQALFHWAVSVARELLELRQAGRVPGRVLALKHGGADRLILRRVREMFGGRLRFMVVSGAPLRREVSEFLTVAGVPVLEAYGLTEATGITHVNRTHRYSLGTVGMTVPGVQCRIADDGEILLRGAPVASTALADEGGGERDLWLQTGDLGGVDGDGFLTITGRKRALIVLASGRKVSPESIERRLQEDAFVSHALVYGDERPFLSALLTLDEARLRQFGAENGFETATLADLSQHPKVYALIERVVQETNARLMAHEQVRKFAILDREFSAESGELTPGQEVRRAVTIEQHRALLESFYRETF